MTALKFRDKATGNWVTLSTSGPPGEAGPAGPPGPEGPEGPAGPSGGSASFTQGVASSVWTITHNLGFYPNVTVVDSAGSAVEGDVQYDSVSQVTLTFTAAFTGVAYLS